MKNTMMKMMAAAAAAMMLVVTVPSAVYADEYTDAGWHYCADMDGYMLTKAQKEEVTLTTKNVLDAFALTGDERTDLGIIYDFVTGHVTYDYDAFNAINAAKAAGTSISSETNMAATAYNAMHGSAVCEGYASFFMNLCTQAGIDCRLYASGTAGHAWNIVYLDGTAYVCDSTWDAGNKGKGYQYYLISPFSYQPMQNADAKDWTAMYRTQEDAGVYYYKEDLADGKYVLNKHHLCIYLWAGQEWKDIDQDVSYGYSGNPVEPEEFIYYNNEHLIKGTDYTVTYNSNSGPGSATVTYTGIGNYTGSITYTFNING